MAFESESENDFVERHYPGLFWAWFGPPSIIMRLFWHLFQENFYDQISYP